MIQTKSSNLIPVHAHNLNQKQPRYRKKSQQKQLQLLIKFHEHNDLTEKAKNFVNKIRNKKKEMEGRMMMRKRAEQEKRQVEEKRKEIQASIQKQIMRTMRRMKAERNVEFYKQKINSRVHCSVSPKSRRFSDLTQQQMPQQSRLRLPSLYQAQLQEIKQQKSNNVPIGLKKTSRKPVIKRSQTQGSNRSQASQQTQQTKLNEPVKNMKQFKKSSDKKHYLMGRNKSDQFSEYLQKYVDLTQLIQSRKGWGCKHSPFKTLNRTRKHIKVAPNSLQRHEGKSGQIQVKQTSAEGELEIDQGDLEMAHKE